MQQYTSISIIGIILIFIIFSCNITTEENTTNYNPDENEEIKIVEYDSLLEEYVKLKNYTSRFSNTDVNPSILYKISKKDSTLIQDLEREIVKLTAEDKYYDVLFKVANEPTFKDSLNYTFFEKSIEIYRLIYSTQKVWDTYHYIYRIGKEGNSIIFSSKTIRFDGDCATPLVGFEDAKEFSSECFTVVDKKIKKIDRDKWTALIDLVNKTEFYNISYVQHHILLCDGEYVILEGVNRRGKKIYNKPYYHIVDILCPNELTAANIISDYIRSL